VEKPKKDRLAPIRSATAEEEFEGKWKERNGDFELLLNTSRRDKAGGNRLRVSEGIGQRGKSTWDDGKQQIWVEKVKGGKGECRKGKMLTITGGKCI
jgi:hypothetical protein